MNIVLIGSGNIGQRYLQSILNERFTHDIYVVDTNIDVLEACGKLLENYSGKTYFLNDIFQLPERIDLVAITTTSIVRKGIIVQLLKQKKVKNMILEKYLFPYENDYKEMKDLFEKCNCRVWVNCTRRAQKSYQKIKKGLEKSESIQIMISGSNWGMGCNSIHFLDIIAYLTGSATLQIDVNELEDKVIESKRNGYKEIVGTIRGCAGRCSDFSIVCYENGQLPLTLYVSSDITKVIINETKQTINVLQDDGNWKIEDFKMLYTSQIMGKIIQEILEKGSCDLASYEESAEIHLALQKELTPFFERHGIDKGMCPIT